MISRRFLWHLENEYIHHLEEGDRRSPAGEGNPGEDIPAAEGSRTRRGEDRNQAAGSYIRGESDSEQTKRSKHIK